MIYIWFDYDVDLWKVHVREGARRMSSQGHNREELERVGQGWLNMWKEKP